jgi:hypothetical protein
MEEIAAFTGEAAPAHEVFVGFARLFEEIAQDVAGEKRDSAVLKAFFETPRQP